MDKEKQLVDADLLKREIMNIEFIYSGCSYTVNEICSEIIHKINELATTNKGGDL